MADRWQAAIHEASHAVMLCHQGFGSRLKAIDMRPRHLRSAQVEIYPGFDDERLTRRKAQKILTVLLAGELAENLALPPYERPMANEVVTNMLDHALELNSDIIQARRIARQLNPYNWRAFVSYAVTLTEKILEQRPVWAAVTGLANALEKHCYMSGHDARRIIKKSITATIRG